MQTDWWQTGPAWATPGRWTATALVSRAVQHPDAVACLGLRTKAAAPADALALLLSEGELAADALLATVRLGELPHSAHRHPATLAALALLWCGRGGPPAESAAGVELYWWLATHVGVRQLSRMHRAALAQAMFLADRTEQLSALLPQLDGLPKRVQHYLRTDLAHPYREGGAAALSPRSAAHRAWERLLSAEFEAAGLAPVRLCPSGSGPAGHLFDLLSSEVGRAGSDPPGGPLVTVVVPAFRPDDGLLTSVTSITAQTHSALEIVVVDDASGPDYESLFDRAVRSDPRVQLVRMPRNGGSYLARQAAIERTEGELITTQDADDWSHPQRIAAQVAVLRDQPHASASRSRAVRAKDDLTHQWFGYDPVRDNASSLMMRRSAMLRAGTFLPMRKGADSEYAERLATLVGPVVDTGSTLAITRLRSDSLSRADFTLHWSDPDRLAFRGTYRAWHRALTAQGARSVSLAADELPIPVADSFVRGLDVQHRRGVDQTLGRCYLGDLSGDPTDPHDPAHEPYLALTGEPGPPTPTGLWHREAPRAVDLRRPEMHPAWFDAIIRVPDLRPVTRLGRQHVDCLVVTSARSLLLLRAQPSAVTAREVQVHLNLADVEPDASGLPVDLLEVSDICLALFGHRPHWVPPPPGRGQEREIVRSALPGLCWLDSEEPRAAGPQGWTQRRVAASTNGTSSSSSCSDSTMA